MSKDSKYKFILIPPFHLPDENEFTVPGYSVPKDKSREERLLNADFVLPHLEDVCLLYTSDAADES